MRDRSAIVRHVWDLLAPGGRLVVADTYLNPGFMRRRFLSMSNWVSSRTLYGRPDTDPRADLARLGGELHEERISMWLYGSQFVIARATKPRA
jgi:hypothetical protein